MTAVIFGASSQDGIYLNQICTAKCINVITVSRSGSMVQGDVADFSFVENIIVHYKPDYIFHLAANSTTKHGALFENHLTISTGTLNILEAVKLHSPNTKVFITGSGVQFKNNGIPISETDEFDAKSPYSVARIQSVYAARYYRSLGIKTYVGYLFHHESPYRKPSHVSKMIILAVQRISSGIEERITIGDISVKKEWTFAGDTVRGILALVEQDEVFEAVIGSGIPYSIEDWLEICFAGIGKYWQDFVDIRKNFKPEYKLLVSNPLTMNNIGWYPTVNIGQLSEMMMNFQTKVKL